MKINKERVEQASITAVITFIVTAVGVTMFGVDAAIYSGIAAGLSITVGKEYGNSLVIENNWHWKDVIPGIAGVLIGTLIYLIFHILY